MSKIKLNNEENINQNYTNHINTVERKLKFSTVLLPCENLYCFNVLSMFEGVKKFNHIPAWHSSTKKFESFN